MGGIFALALRSLYNRRGTALLTVLSLAVSVTLLLGVHRIQISAKQSFQNTLSGTDLVVGARSGAVQLLLYSVFRLGAPTSNLSWRSYEFVANHPEVAWTIPLSLGDSHRGYRVVGTNESYFRHYRYGEGRELSFAGGREFRDIFEVVLGAEVARSLGYRVGDRLTLSHGIDEVSFQEHGDKPFEVVGVLERTGTPVDRSLHVPLEGIEAIHLGWESGAAPRADQRVSAEEARRRELAPRAVTAALVGLKSKVGIFQLQREIQQYRDEPLSAVLPGATFQELWSTVAVAETALAGVSWFVVIAGLLGMLTALLTSLGERRREMAILRSVGASPAAVFALLVAEATALAAAGVVTGAALLFGGLIAAASPVGARYGLNLAVTPPDAFEFGVGAAVVAAGFLVGCVPAWQAYRRSLADGLSIRI